MRLRAIGLVATSALVTGVLVPVLSAPAQAATNHQVSVTCDQDVHIEGEAGDTYTFTFTGFCLDPRSNSQPDEGQYLDQLNFQNANSTGTMDCATQFTAPGFLRKPGEIEVDQSSSGSSDQTSTLADYYCYATDAVDSQAQYELPAGTPTDEMDWYFYTNQDLPEGAAYVRATMELLAANALGTPLADGAVVATISNNKASNTWKVIYDSVTAPSSEPTIAITKSRDGNVVTIKGTTTGFRAGSKVTPHFKTSAAGDFAAGKKVTVAANGKFKWNRNVKKKQTLWVYFTGKGVTSNIVQVKG